MGVTIKCRKTGKSIDMSYSGFNRLRNKIATLVGEPFASHYLSLDSAPAFGKERQLFVEMFDEKTEEMLRDGKVRVKIADFLLQSDCDGKIRYGACKELLGVIGDYNDSVRYGYAGRDDCAMFMDFVAILQDCVESKSDLVWR